jgi:Xaa-Pro aminopeptidase
MRAVKSPREVARQRQAYRIGESIYREVLASIARNPNQTVSDVRATQMAMATRAGCPPLHFGYVFPQGPGKVAWDYANVPSYTFARGDVVLLDLGLIWKGYTTDFGRNATLGKARPEVREVYDKTVRCREAIARTVRPGVRASEVVQAAAKTREQLGLPAVLAVGHSLGVECHEQPSLHVNDQTVLEEGMTLVIELVEGSKEFVFLLEDAGLVTADGWQTLTEMGTELVELDV